MTNTNMSCEPLLLSPAGKDYLWGGHRLKTEFGKPLDCEPLAESWECSTHPDGPCRIASGPLAGQTLAGALAAHPEWLGSHPRQNGFSTLPVLIKFIDAASDLSVQVHPDDEYALAHEGQLGKTEMWYVIDAAPGARLVYGFAHSMTPERVRRAAAQGRLMQYLQYVPVHAGDVFFIRPGTLHAIGGGILLAEVQQSSNVTYRVYDYDRRDKNGQLRPLHLEKALQVLDYRRSPEARQPLRVLRYRPGMASELLCSCKYFRVERLLLNTQSCRALAKFAVGENSFQVLLCVEGCGTIYPEGGAALPFFRGDCVFLPAGSAPFKLHGSAQLLRVTC